MAQNFYLKNRQKLLYLVQELHARGYGKLRIIPSIAPSGLAWRCIFIDESNKHECIASPWIDKIESEFSQSEIHLPIHKLADQFIQENTDFLEHCKGKNKAYEKWFIEMLENLKDDELPYAYDIAEQFFPTDYWLTNKGSKIKTLPNEKDYYLK